MTDKVIIRYRSTIRVYEFLEILKDFLDVDR